MPDEALARLAEAWLFGWDAGQLDKPESACPFTREEPNQFADMWERGWEAGVRKSPRDLRAKQRFLAISMGLETKDAVAQARAAGDLP